MQVVFDNIPIDNCWSSRPSSPEINTATALRTIRKITHARHGHAPVVSLLSQMMMQKMLKN